MQNSDKPHVCVFVYVCTYMHICIHMQCHLVAEWLRVGYVQGNMNSDNTALGGYTIDFGPFGMMEEYHPVRASNTCLVDCLSVCLCVLCLLMCILCLFPLGCWECICIIRVLVCLCVSVCLVSVTCLSARVYMYVCACM